MADEGVLSMSLDEIIKLKKIGTKSNPRGNNAGARGRPSYRVRRGIARISGNQNRTGPKLRVNRQNLRGHVRMRYHRASQGVLQSRYRNWNVNHQRQYSIALGRSRLQAAKNFLRQKQSQNQGKVWQSGVSQRARRGRGGILVPALRQNTFRSDQLMRLSRANAYQNKINRRRGALQRNQPSTAPSLIVSIENDRVDSYPPPNNMRGTRGRRGLFRGRGAARNNRQQQGAAYRRVPEQNFDRGSDIPYHTGALNPEIQMVIADIQGKRNQNTFGAMNNNTRRGSVSARGARYGRTDLQHRRNQYSRMQGTSLTRQNPGLPLGMTVNTLNERFGGRR